MLTLQKWSTKENSGLNAENLKSLFNNDTPAIRIPQFATSEECEALANVSSG